MLESLSREEICEERDSLLSQYDAKVFEWDVALTEHQKKGAFQWDLVEACNSIANQMLRMRKAAYPEAFKD